MTRSIKEYISIGLKGMGMGAADVVPGVSGGTIAFITGIYEELIDSIKSVDGKALQLLFKFKIKELWNHINGWFLVAVFGGIAISVLSLARILKYLLAEKPVLIWAFFFGLIVASAIFVAKKVKKWEWTHITSIISGTIIAYFITVVTPAETPETMWFLFLSGALAICAMILPGISGAFILLLLGKYEFILEAVTSFDMKVIAIVGVGAVVGLLSFSRFLSFLLHKYHDQTIALLAGFMIGSLNKVWPWKETTEWRINSHGEQVPLLQENIGPGKFSQITGEPNFLLWAIILAIAGFGLIYVVETVSGKSNK